MHFTIAKDINALGIFIKAAAGIQHPFNQHDLRDE
jgi:hypothetical protein